MVGDQNADKGIPSKALLLIGILLVIVLIGAGTAVSGDGRKDIYMDCVNVVFIDNKSTPKTYKSTVVSRTDEERSLLDSDSGIVRTLQSRTPFYFIASDMKSYTVKEGNCYGIDV